MKISIVTPWAGETADLLPDYRAAVTGAEVVIVDNATPPDTALALGQAAVAEGWQYLRNEANQGFAGGNNQGYAAATGDVIVFLNSDIAAPPALLDAIGADVRDGALYGPSLQAQLVAGRWLPYLEGWCIAATIETWQRLAIRWRDSTDTEPLGPWDHDAYPGPYWEDNDLCFRAAQAGIALIQTQWPVQHKGGRTAGPLVRHAASFEANRATFAQYVLNAFAGQPGPPQTPALARYYQELSRDSDIRHHLPFLRAAARGNVVELGTRGGVSTVALLAGVEAHGGRVISVDTDDCSQVAYGHPLWSFLHGSSTDPASLAAAQSADLVPIDLLLIDTEHTIAQVSAELALWAPAMRPGGIIALHDPETFPGVRRAVDDFCAASGWPVRYVLPNNGMAIVEVPDGEAHS